MINKTRLWRRVRIRVYIKRMQNIVIDGFNFAFIGAYIGYKDESDTEENKLNKTLSVLDGMLNKLDIRFPSANMYACWDSPGGVTFRKQLDENYKANRPEKKLIDFKAIATIREMFKERGISDFSIKATEGDDAVFALCKALREEHPLCENIIVTRDRDMIQVVQAGYARGIYEPVRKDFIDIPDYPVTMFKALVGDRSDNIPGVKGIGEAKAKKLIANQMKEGKLELNEDQLEQYEKYLKMVDATKHPRFDENVRAAKMFLEKTK